MAKRTIKRSSIRFAERGSKGQEIVRGPGSILDSMAKIPDGKNVFMAWIKMVAAENEQSTERFGPILHLWEKNMTEYDRKYADLDAMFEHYNIDPSDAIGRAARAASKHAVSVTQILYAIHMADIAAANIKEAKKPRGIKDREMAMQATGIMPQRPGVTSNVFVNAQANAGLTQSGELSGVVPFEDDVMSLTEAIRIGIESKE